MKKLLAMSLIILLGLSACGHRTIETSPPATDAKTWQEQYDLGVRYLSEGNYEEAIPRLMKLRLRMASVLEVATTMFITLMAGCIRRGGLK